jgi:hemolysin III
MTGTQKRVRFWREPFSTASHLAGFVLAVLLLPLLIHAAGNRPQHLIGALAFGLALILVYASSTLFHGVVASPRTLTRLMQFDLVAIFLLIFGTYTPLCLVTLAGPLGWGLLAAEGVLALLGIVLVFLREQTDSRHHRLYDGARIGLYLVMGWLVILAADPLFRSLSSDGAFWLVAGGVAYSVGAVVFATDRPHLLPGKFSAHDLWHCFVLAGSFLHVAFVMRHIFTT